MARIGIVQPGPNSSGVATFNRVLRAQLLGAGHEVALYVHVPKGLSPCRRRHPGL
jgi:hypothetical protein